MATRLNLFIPAIWEVYCRASGTTGGVTKLVSFISYPAKALTRRFDDIAPRKQVVEEGAMRIPTFYTAEISSSDSHMERLSRMQWVIAYIISVMFAACNILPFVSTAFPTLAERIVWTLSSSLAVFLVPVLFFLIHRSIHGIRTMLIAKISTLLGIYILARIILFVLGFTTLRGLPPGALNTTHWPNFILIFIGN